MANSKSTRQYVALTTHGGGWWVVLAGEPGQGKAEVQEGAETSIVEEYGGVRCIEGETELKNLHVLSISAARKAFPKAMYAYDNRFETDGWR